MTDITPTHANDVQTLKQLIRKCVHCGFCNATCPSYQQLGNELDGPRGRIYQIANMINGDSDDVSIRTHLDSCLQCRNCETTCPSSVEYNRIFSLGKELATTRYPYSLKTRLQQALLIALFSNASTSKLLFRIGSLFRACMPSTMRQAIPKREKPLPLVATDHCQTTVLLMQGCVQSGAYPNTNRALHNLCARLNIRLVFIKPVTCCGAIAHHTNKNRQAIEQARANIDACWSHIEQGINGIVISASACVLELTEYPQLLRHDPYAEKAKVFADLIRDPSDLLSDLPSMHLNAQKRSLAFHPPCTLQHGLGKSDTVEQLLIACGFQLESIDKKHLCCGSAGTFSIFQPDVAKALRKQKIATLCTNTPDYLATANIGCQMFLQQKVQQKVWHWVELIEYFANQQKPLY